ncbi:DUF3885 domain-containing protein [Metabacillus niabensis]|uniref:DUF3885 domain-containing protein n=1 Tax=Metabacillus TaxID=2675233 RepID=UPI00119F4372
MELKEYLQTTFPGLDLVPSLYNQWNIGLHFELGRDLYQFKEDGRLNLELFEMVYSQAMALFSYLFSEQDEIFLVTNVYRNKRNTRSNKIKVFERHLKNKALKYNVKTQTLPFLYDDEEERDEYFTSQFYLKCRKSDINYPLLIRAACNEDFPFKPKFGFSEGLFYPDVFFINISKNIIFFIYDDRGCEVISKTKETICPLYTKYNDWIPEYNREEIEQLFKSPVIP